MFAILASCAQFPDQKDGTKGWAAKQFYAEGQDALKAGNYDTAISYFQQLQKRYPKDKHSPQAQLEIAYAYYKAENADQAVHASNKYIDDYSNQPHVDYAYYLKGLARYAEGVEQVDAGDISDNASTTTVLRDAFRHFASLTRRFPNSKYTEDALQRMVEIRNKLAEYEVRAARMDLDSGKAENAAKRAEFIIEHYQNSPMAPEAYSIMASAYQSLGLNDLANDALLTLKQKYPGFTAESKQPAPVIAEKPKDKKTSAAAMMSTTEAIKKETPPTKPVVTKVTPRKPASKPPAPRQTKQTPKMPAAPAHREDWILKQNPSHFTLQIIGVGNEAALNTFINKYGLQNKAAYFHTRQDGRDWYSLIYGAYTDKDSAKKAAGSLAPALRRSKPWIRPMSDVQSAIQLNKTTQPARKSSGTVAPQPGS